MYSRIIKFTCVALFVVVVSVSAAPSRKKVNFQPCHKSDQNFKQCYKNELQKVIPLIADGYQKFRIPPIEPFELPALAITKGQGAVSIDLSLIRVKIHGLSAIQFETVNIDPERLTAHIKFFFPKPIHLIGSYTAKGKVQVLPIDGKGFCNITLVGAEMELTDVQGEKVERNGFTHITLRKAALKATKVRKVILRLDNLFQGNKELSDNLIVFINENWELLFDELKPAFEEAIITIIKDVAEKVFAKVSYDDIFPA